MLPKRFPGLAIELEEEALAGVFIGGDEKNGVVPNDGRGVADTGDLGFPFEVFFERPGEGGFLIGADAIAAWATPAGPIVGEEGCCEAGEEERNS